MLNIEAVKKSLFRKGSRRAHLLGIAGVQDVAGEERVGVALSGGLRPAGLIDRVSLTLRVTADGGIIQVGGECRIGRCHRATANQRGAGSG